MMRLYSKLQENHKVHLDTTIATSVTTACSIMLGGADATCDADAVPSTVASTLPNNNACSQAHAMQ